jgi:hypothetical protein
VHPLIRVVALLVFIAGLALARPTLLGAGFVLLLLLYRLTGFPAPRILLRMLVRLRWLLVAILLVYGWSTPGAALLPAISAWSPTVEGMSLGLLRILSLVMIVAAVHLLMQVTNRKQLLPAIMQLINPVTTVTARERLAVRILLSIEAVTQVQSLVSETLTRQPLKNHRLSTLGVTAQTLYMSVLNKAALAGENVIEIVEPESPPLWQWLVPVALSAVIYMSV